MEINIIDKIRDNDPLVKIANIVGRVVTDLSFLRHNTHLKELFIHDNQVSDLSVLRFNNTLVKLSLIENKVSDISALAHNTTLRSLNLTKNEVSDVSSLAYNATLEILNLQQNNISDISPLKLNTTLKEVNLRFNHITTFDNTFSNNFNLTNTIFEFNPGYTKVVRAQITLLTSLNKFNLKKRSCTLFDLLQKQLQKPNLINLKSKKLYF